MTRSTMAAVGSKDPITDLTDRIRTLGMWWELDGDDAFLHGNTEALSMTLLGELRTHKAEIVAYLREQRAALARLEERLEHGWLICEAETDPDRRDRYDDHWVALLHDYKASTDRVSALFGEPVP